jgi:threonylcarbamoyladenosine tRNA methylthiotransferase MtaB
MAAFLMARGHEAVNSEQVTDNNVDAVIVNTCTVTAAADKKSRNAIRKLRKQFPGALLCVCGCLPQTEELAVEGIDLVGGTAGRMGFIEKLEKLAVGAHCARLQAGTDLPNEYDDTLPDARPLGRSRAYIKIQDGCDNRCAYCKVPLARGSSRSRPVESVIRAVKSAAGGGAAEIILTGIEISSFRPSLADLTVQACRAAVPVPVRLSSLHPDIVDGSFVAALKGEEGFSPSFHLSLQSACDKILAAMGRRYTVKDIFKSFELLRAGWPDAVITADIIVGFPGESADDFEETFTNLKKLNPAGLHVFPYSRRKGTPAAEMLNENTRAVKAERVRRLMREFPAQNL